MSETFGERVARLCDERGVPKYRVLKACGVKVVDLDRSRTVSVKAARGIAEALGMTIAELDAPISVIITTSKAVSFGLIEEPTS